jgi:hypothetical protein
MVHRLVDAAVVETEIERVRLLSGARCGGAGKRNSGALRPRASPWVTYTRNRV